MARRPTRTSTSARWIAGVLVGVLAVGTIVLAALAVDRTRSTPERSAPAPVPTFSLGQRPATPSTPTPQPADSTAAPADAADIAPADQRFLTIGSGVIWRATAGECGAAAPLIERSADGGSTWADVTPRYRGIAEVASLDPFAGTQAEVIAAMGADCSVEALRTFTQGEFWAPYADVLAASRYLDPSNPASVVTPGGTIAAPCERPQSFRAQGDLVALVCDGVALRLVDGQWAPLPPQNVAALAISNDAVVTAQVAAGCDGVAVSRWSGEGLATEQALGCAPGADPTAPLAVAASGDGATVWSGDRLIPAA